MGEDGGQGVGAVGGAGDADVAVAGEQLAGACAGGCGEVARGRGGLERLACDVQLEAAAQEVGGADVEVGEVGRSVGPQGGEEGATGDAGDDADAVEEIAVVKGAQAAEVEGCGAGAAAGQGEAEGAGHEREPLRGTGTERWGRMA
ncbi:hypothetical protein GCM10010365_74790 [Streptomyces poonensis]|uniref:Uncharacterized protein n=1 Tax=Streptomyces poonensis TaxID=68255 RepID=A0A918QFC4_9ACTN|nr:hypothetical protein GCM10010365_74790 [Streptomyces poonensis]